MRKLNLILSLLVLILLVGTSVMAGCGTPKESATAGREGWPASLTFSGTSIGSSIHIVTMAYGNMIQKYLGVSWNYEPAASLTAAQLLRDGKLDIGCLTGDALCEAGTGAGQYQGKKITNLRILFPNLLQAFCIATRAADNIKTVEGFKGKRYTWSGSSYASTTFSEHLLASAGLKWEDVQKTPGTSMSGVTGLLTDRKTDVLEWIGNSVVGEPTFLEMSRLIDVYWVPLTEQQQRYISQRLPYFPAGQINPYLYKGQEKAVPANVVMMTFTVRKEIPDTLVYELMKVAFDHNEEFRAGHPAMGTWTPDYALQNAPPAAWHAGAVKYWKDRGLWTKENESKQKALLAEMGQDK